MEPVEYAARVAVLVIKPGDQLNLPAHHGGQAAIDDHRMRIAFDISRHQLVIGKLQDTAVGVGGSGAEQVVHLFGTDVLRHLQGDIGQGAIGEGYADG